MLDIENCIITINAIDDPMNLSQIYHCVQVNVFLASRKGCKYNSSTKNIHEAFEEGVNKYALSDKVTELLKLQLTITFENMNKENRERAQSIKSNIKAKEKELEKVETNYTLCYDAKKARDMCKGYDEIRRRN